MTEYHPSEDTGPPLYQVLSIYTTAVVHRLPSGKTSLLSVYVIVQTCPGEPRVQKMEWHIRCVRLLLTH